MQAPRPISSTRLGSAALMLRLVTVWSTQFPEGGSSQKRRLTEADRQRFLPNFALTQQTLTQRCRGWDRHQDSHRWSQQETDPALPTVQARRDAVCKPPEHAPVDHSPSRTPAPTVLARNTALHSTSGLTSKTRNTYVPKPREIYTVLSSPFFLHEETKAKKC